MMREMAHSLRRQRGDLAQLLDVSERVAARTALGATGNDESETVVLTQGLRMHARQLGRGRDRKDRRLFIDLVVHDSPRSLATPAPCS